LVCPLNNEVRDGPRLAADGQLLYCVARYRYWIQTAVPGFGRWLFKSQMVETQTKPRYDYALRLYWWTGTDLAGAVAQLCGPDAGGLFLLPAIFCARATLTEKHERDRKQRLGLSAITVEE